MSLSQLANESNKQADEKRRADRAEYWLKVTANCEAMIAKILGSLDVPVVALDRVKETELKVYRQGGFDEKRQQETHVVSRYRVDDVVLRLQAGSRNYHDHTYAPEIGYVALERACDHCGRQMGMKLNTWSRPDPDAHAEDFIKQIGIQLRTKAVCSFCKANASQPCPECGHHTR